jgi:ArsR family transcriptional regulator, arsenate/arsenite/antimonite-responsive transcriptional repressor
LRDSFRAAAAPSARRSFQYSSKRLDFFKYFDIRRNMEKFSALAALAALAQENRLDVFRLLVEAGPGGMPAGTVAEALGLAPNTLTFHFDRLRVAGLVTVQRQGRSMIYAAQFDQMNALIDFLTESCCAGVPSACKQVKCEPARAKGGAKTKVSP